MSYDEILDGPAPTNFRPHTRVVDSDPITKTVTKFHVDADGKFHVWDEQDVGDVVERAVEEYKEASGFKNDIVKVASIPLAVWQTLQKAGITRDDKLLRRWLNNSDNRKFRTRPGRV